MKCVRYTSELSNSKNMCVTPIQKQNSQCQVTVLNIRSIIITITLTLFILNSLGFVTIVDDIITFHHAITNCMVDNHIINICIPSGLRSLTDEVVIFARRRFAAESKETIHSWKLELEWKGILLI